MAWIAGRTSCLILSCNFIMGLYRDKTLPQRTQRNSNNRTHATGIPKPALYTYRNQTSCQKLNAD
jgi:hypothetical protein